MLGLSMKLFILTNSAFTGDNNQLLGIAKALPMSYEQNFIPENEFNVSMLNDDDQVLVAGDHGIQIAQSIKIARPMVHITWIGHLEPTGAEGIDLRFDSEASIRLLPIPIYEVGKKFNFTKNQTQAIVQHWYLAGLLRPEYLRDVVGADLNLPSIEEIITMVTNATKVSSSGEELFDADAFICAFYPPDFRINF